MSEEELSHKQIYQKIVDRVKEKETLSALDQRTILTRLLRTPETYKLDFATLLLPQYLGKSEEKERDELIFEHYRHYVSVPCFSALLSALKKSELSFGEPIKHLIEHIRQLQLMPGPQAKDRDLFESLQINLMGLLHDLSDQPKQSLTLDLSTKENRRELAELYYNQLMMSFISEDDDDLITEEQFIEGLKQKLIGSESVQNFAGKALAAHQGERSSFLKELGLVLNQTIKATYDENYLGIFNGPKSEVIDRFESEIENRVNDSDQPKSVALDPITSSIVAAAIELIFNSGLSTFRDVLTQRVQESLK